ncbi:RagB/SusD family nutrient uptake outer membrane protein [Solitalea sp. MAHUQ-68]|uniref:RagB/SusD family nutrient uptake outer membrane protein n=1 Tax=Solitalea agri TaxID=2953739 RepID=A0A9X2JDA8_9SPHI|nr:RagB/SusD family nutrient uptake outer membrane protein [Solitalea agri]MCO4292705.1 RagB/SusD family nutrient uptake outer membrane protein [Solitalea agri]
MKTKNIKTFLLAGLVLLSSSACEKNFEPSTAISDESALTNAGDIETATIGTYAVLRGSKYVRSYHFLTEYQSDEIAQGQNSSDDLSRCYRYTHVKNGSHLTNFWQQAYKVAFAANKIIGAIPDNANGEMKRLKGENLFLRAMVHFNLVRIYGRPYTQNNGNNPGVPILKDGLTEEQANTISRSSVAQVYDFVINDLLSASALMEEGERTSGTVKANYFATSYAANALLSRVYLYKGDNTKAIEFADKVINSGKYELLQGNAFKDYFKIAPESNKETIFAIRFTKAEDESWGAIGSMYYSGNPENISQPAAQGVGEGYAEVYASQSLVDEYAKNPSDLRSSFIAPYTISGVLQLNSKLSPKTPMYYVTKYSLQEGKTNLSSPVYLRLAEMFLIRAEANAKLGNTQLALNDLNVIRNRAGIPALTTADVSVDKTILDLVLNERRLELAFECHRAYDLFRNDKPMKRNYPGTHSLNNTPNTNITQTIQPTDARVIFFLPEVEVNKNPNLVQNQ